MVVFLLFSFSLVGNVQANHQGCLTAGFWIEESVYNFFDPAKNPKSHNTFGQWSDRQMNEWNKMLSSSGARDCFKIGKIVRVQDGALPLAGGSATTLPDNKDRTVDVTFGFPKSILEKEGQKSIDYWTERLNAIDWGLLHELSHARYLSDEYAYNVAISNVQVTDPNGKPVVGNYIKPQGDIVHYADSHDFMSYHEVDHFYRAHTVGALNRIAGQHTAEAVGNYNFPSNGGVYMNDLPNNNFLKIRDKDNNPLRGASIRIFRSVRVPNSGYDKIFDNTADFRGAVDDQASISIGQNPFGRKLDGYYPGIFLLEVAYNGQYYYQFIESSNFNLAYWAGATDTAVYDIKTSFTKVDTPITAPSGPEITALEPSVILPPATLVIKGKGFGKDMGSVDFQQENSESTLGPSFYRKTEWTDDHITVIMDKVPFNQMSGGTRWRVIVTTSTGQQAKKEWLIGAQITTAPQKSKKITSFTNPYNIGTVLDIQGEGFGEVAQDVQIKGILKGQQVTRTLSLLDRNITVRRWTDTSVQLVVEDPGYIRESSDWKLTLIFQDGQVDAQTSITINPRNSAAPTLAPSFRAPIATQPPTPAQEPTVTLAPLSGQHQIESLVISNYPDFREGKELGDEGSETVKISNPLESQTLPWIRSTISVNPIYVRKINTDETRDEFTVSLGNNQSTQIEGVQLMSKIKRKLLRMVINGGEVDLSSKHYRLQLKGDQSVNPYSVPVVLYFSSGEPQYLVLNFTYSGSSAGEQTRQSGRPPTVTLVPATSPSVSAETCKWDNRNPECDWDLKQVYEVQQNSCTGAYRKLHYRTQVGACGAVATGNATENSPSQPTPTASNGCTWKQLKPECDWTLKQVYEVYRNSCTGEYDKRNYHVQIGVCGATIETPVNSNTCPYSEGFTKGDGSFGIRECTGTKQNGACKYDPSVNPNCNVIQ